MVRAGLFGEITHGAGAYNHDLRGILFSNEGEGLWRRFIFRDYPPRVYVDGSPKEEFTSLEPYKAKYEHPLWTRMGEIAKDLGGHGGMDFIMAYRLIECMKTGTAPDIDVYDAAAWSAAGPLSEASVAAGGAPQKFPDFTGGRWRLRQPV